MKWNTAFAFAEKYYKEHGNLLVPPNHIEGGFNLSNWISRQRYRYSIAHNPNLTEEERGERKRRTSPLTKEQIARLTSIGMVWNANDYSWERAFAVAEAYYKEHGNLLVPLDYTRDGVNLSNWIRTQRQIRLGTLANHKAPMSEERIRRLDSIGMAWQPYDSMWERSFAVAQKYYREHGNLVVPKHYEEDGVNLSHWIWAQRRIVAGTSGETGRKLTQEQIDRLESIGMVWAPKTKGFAYYYGQCRRFYDTYGHTDFPDGEVEVDGEIMPESGEVLTAWKREQERADIYEKTGGAVWEHRKLLREIGIDPEHGLSPWEKKFRVAEEYYREHGNLIVPYSYVTEDGVRLGRWISNQRLRRKGTAGSKPTEEQIRRLDAIGMSWNEEENRGKKNSAEKNGK